MLLDSQRPRCLLAALARGVMVSVIFAAVSGNLPAQEVTQAAADSSKVLEEGFSGNSSADIDYDALVKELYGAKETPADKPAAETATEPGEAEQGRWGPKKLGPAPGMFRNSRLNGAHVAINASSPFAVAEPLTSWYSYIDAGLILKLPYEVYVETIPLYLLMEVSTFSFENSYPQGGSFAGLAYIFQASTIGENSGAAMGFGFWDGSLGSMLELNYRLRPTTNTFFRLGTRGVLITDVELIGATWWLELRLSLGLEL